LIDDDLGLAEVILERHDVFVQAAKEEASIVLEARDFLQIVRAMRIELHRILGGLLVFYLQKLAGIGECPAVKRTGEAAFVAVLATAKHRAFVRASVADRVQFAGFVTRDDDRLAANPRGVVIVIVRNLAFVCEIHPIALEDVLHLEHVQIGVREDVATAAENTVFLVILNGVAQ
jgi:hypothetical protein